jgi:hypothetical protein
LGCENVANDLDEGTEECDVRSINRDVDAIKRDTMIIFDWDDTLLCSTAINQNTWTQDQMNQLEEAVAAVLLTSMHLGETIIVTNGNYLWVEESTRCFLPRLQPLMSRLEVISARAKYEDAYPGEPYVWKREAFKQILCRRSVGMRQNVRQFQTAMNLLVLGDSPAEIEAAKTAATAMASDSLVKPLKFKVAPTIDEVLGQLRRVSQELPSLVQDKRSISQALVNSGGVLQTFMNIGSASSASSWTLAEVPW